MQGFEFYEVIEHDIKIIFDDAGFEFLGASLKKTTQPMATPSWIRTINNHI